jgi:pSer/pThr/pTyr-binding forkhead associated (FHA) protein
MKISSTQLIPANQAFEVIDVSRSKLLIGSALNCDITLIDASISHYHALIESDKDGVMIIIDLNSPNGVYINGSRIQGAAPLTEEDSLTIGKVHYTVLSMSEKVEFNDLDKEVEVSEAQTKVFVPKQMNANEILIDDEFCNIIFDESHFNPLQEIALNNLSISDYIQPDELERSFNLERKDYAKCIQITTLTTGVVLDQYYLPPSFTSMKASQEPTNKSILIESLQFESEDFLSLSDGCLEVQPLSGFSISRSTLSLEDDKTTLILTKGTYQIFIEISNVPNHLINIPQITREKGFIKDSSKIFAGIMLPLLLLLLVNFEIPKPKKKLSIIYKKPTNAKVDEKKLASTSPTDKVRNTGHKTTKQPEKKVTRSKTGKKATAKAKSKPIQKVTKAQKAPSKSSKKAKAPVKAYQFKMASNVKSLFSNSKAVAKTASRSIASSSASSANALSGSLNTKVSGTASGEVGNMGSDLSGAEASMGAKGLSSKSGRDTSYIQTKTVVLGSMDPELLRKILQRYLPQFRHCYQEELSNNSEDIKGIVDLNFTIVGSGKVTEMDIKAKDKRFSKSGINCMTRVLSIIDFPKPKGGGRVAVRQPLSFFSEQENS